MTCCILPKRVYILEFCSRFMTVPVPPRQPSANVTVNSPADSRGDLGARSSRTVPPLSITFSQLLLHLAWPHTGLWSETIFPQHELDSDSPARKSLNTCPGSQDKGGVDKTPVLYPVLPSSGSSLHGCVPLHPPRPPYSLCLEHPHPRSGPHTWTWPLGSGLAPLDT